MNTIFPLVESIPSKSFRRGFDLDGGKTLVTGNLIGRTPSFHSWQFLVLIGLLFVSCASPSGLVEKNDVAPEGAPSVIGETLQPNTTAQVAEPASSPRPGTTLTPTPTVVSTSTPTPIPMPARTLLATEAPVVTPDRQSEAGPVQATGIPVKELAQQLHIVNPTDMPLVYAYVWNDGKTDTYLLDDSSRMGSEYRVQWTITPQGTNFEGPHIRQSSSNIDSLSDSQPLAIAVAFTKSADRSSQAIFEHRFKLQIMQDGLVEMSMASEEWQNLDWPTGEWVRADIDRVINIECCFNRLIIGHD